MQINERNPWHPDLSYIFYPLESHSTASLRISSTQPTCKLQEKAFHVLFIARAFKVIHCQNQLILISLALNNCLIEAKRLCRRDNYWRGQSPFAHARKLQNALQHCVVREWTVTLGLGDTPWKRVSRQANISHQKHSSWQFMFLNLSDIIAFHLGLLGLACLRNWWVEIFPHVNCCFVLCICIKSVWRTTIVFLSMRNAAKTISERAY